MADTRLGAIAKIPLFARVPRRHLRTLLKRMSEYSYEDGVTILKDGRPGEVLFVLLDGEARVVRGGRTVARLRRGDFFGEVAAEEPSVAWALLEELASRFRGD
jgi:CRP-like cAMP-binding protein